MLFFFLFFPSPRKQETISNHFTMAPELHATSDVERIEAPVRGRQRLGEALAALDADVNRMLEKRRWILARAQERRAR